MACRSPCLRTCFAVQYAVVFLIVVEDQGRCAGALGSVRFRSRVSVFTGWNGELKIEPRRQLSAANSYRRWLIRLAFFPNYDFNVPTERIQKLEKAFRREARKVTPHER